MPSFIPVFLESILCVSQSIIAKYFNFLFISLIETAILSCLDKFAC